MIKEIENIYNEIKNNKAIIENLTERINELNAPFSFEKTLELKRLARETGNEKPYNEYKTKRDETYKIIGALSDDIYKLNIKNALLMHNAKTTFINSVLPVVVDVLNKYTNKAIGKVTLDKIQEETKTACNCFVSFHNSNEIHISSFDYSFKFDVSTKYDKEKNEFPPILIDNKLQPINADDLQICFCSSVPFIDGLNEYTNTLIEKREKINALSRELSELISDYNHTKTDYLSEINYISEINKTITFVRG